MPSRLQTKSDDKCTSYDEVQTAFLSVTGVTLYEAVCPAHSTPSLRLVDQGKLLRGFEGCTLVFGWPQGFTLGFNSEEK